MGPGSDARSAGEVDGVSTFKEPPAREGHSQVNRQLLYNAESYATTEEKSLTPLVRKGLASPSQRR